MKKLFRLIARRMFNDRRMTRPEERPVKSYVLSDDDAQQVRAILLTHAELSDQHTIESEKLLGRMKHDEPGEVAMIEDLQEQVDDFGEDTDNLKRIAAIFE